MPDDPTKFELDSLSSDTIMAHAGRDTVNHHGIVNLPVYRASTILFPTIAALQAAAKPDYSGYRYARFGTPTTRALEQAMAQLEGGGETISLPSGLAAITTSLLAYLRPGDHLLMTDSTYGPTRAFCDGFLAQIGVETSYFDPLLTDEIIALMRPNTRILYLESPGSLSFEIQDIPALTQAARQVATGPLTVMLDNSWATPLFFRPFDHGVDVSIHAGTKYIVGHSDALMGLVTIRPDYDHNIRNTAAQFGLCAGPDDCYLALRGLRSLGVRLRQHEQTGLALAGWLKERPEIQCVLHPAFPDCPGHSVWQRDFLGSSGLFGVILHCNNPTAIAAMLDGLKLFGMGYSWGGFESLILSVTAHRTAKPWQESGSLLRIHAGLEAVTDLIADLEAGFMRLHQAQAS